MRRSEQPLLERGDSGSNLERLLKLPRLIKKADNDFSKATRFMVFVRVSSNCGLYFSIA